MEPPPESPGGLNLNFSSTPWAPPTSPTLRLPMPTLDALANSEWPLPSAPGPITAAFNAATGLGSTPQPPGSQSQSQNAFKREPTLPHPPLPTAGFSAGLSPKFSAGDMMSPGISSGVAGTIPPPNAAARAGASDAAATLTELFMSPEYAAPQQVPPPTQPTAAQPAQQMHQQSHPQHQSHQHSQQNSQSLGHLQGQQHPSHQQQQHPSHQHHPQQSSQQHSQHNSQPRSQSHSQQRARQQPQQQPRTQAPARQDHVGGASSGTSRPRPTKKARATGPVGGIPPGVSFGGGIAPASRAPPARGLDPAELQAGSAVEEAQRAAAAKAERFADERKQRRLAEANIAKRPRDEEGDMAGHVGEGVDGNASDEAGDASLPPDELRKKRYLRRLELNRQSAAVSRVRRREYVKELEDKLVGVEKEKYKLQSQVDAMGNENLKLRAQMKALQTQLGRPPAPVAYMPVNGGGAGSRRGGGSMQQRR